VAFLAKTCCNFKTCMQIFSSLNNKLMSKFSKTWMHQVALSSRYHNTLEDITRIASNLNVN
jgi:hypothetical protein